MKSIALRIHGISKNTRKQVKPMVFLLIGAYVLCKVIISAIPICTIQSENSYKVRIRTFCSTVAELYLPAKPSLSLSVS